MASFVRPPLQTGTPARLAVSPDRTLSVREFLRSLKKATRPFPAPQRSQAPQDNTSSKCQLTVQSFLRGLRKPVTPLSKPTEAAEAPKPQMIASTGLEDLPFTDAGLLDPPKSSPIVIDSEQVLSPRSEAKTRPPTPEDADEKGVTGKILNVTRTYTKKAKHVSPQRNDGPALFLTQSSTHEGALLGRFFDDGSDSQTERLHPSETPKTKPAKKHTSTVPQKRKRQPLHQDEVTHRVDHSDNEADTVIIEKKKKSKGKKRRVPVNQLALVKRLSSREGSPANTQKAYDSDNAIDLLNENLDQQDFSACTSPSPQRNRKPKRANTGKPVTRIRQGITIPQREILPREGFQFPPIAPRADKSTGWRPGSGFEGITLELSTNKRPKTSRNQSIRHARTPCFLKRSLPKLELSTNPSPVRHSVGQRGVLERLKNKGDSVESRKYESATETGTGNGAAEDGRVARAGGKAALPFPPVEKDQFRIVSSSHRKGNIKEPVQLHQSQNRDLYAIQAIREPSQSERNGWLKRKRVAFAVTSKDDEQQIVLRTERTSVHASERGKEPVRSGLDSYLDNITQAQRNVYNDSPASSGGGQTNSDKELPFINQEQEIFLQEPRAKQHPHPALRDAADQSSHFEKIPDRQDSGYQEPAPSSGSEVDSPTSPLHGKGPPMPKARHHIEVPRASEIPETQKRLEESLELDHTTTESVDRGRHPYHVLEKPLDSGRYFSNAIRQSDSPEKVPHPIARRRSC